MSDDTGSETEDGTGRVFAVFAVHHVVKGEPVLAVWLIIKPSKQNPQLVFVKQLSAPPLVLPEWRPVSGFVIAAEAV